jgi:hypothetical protein
MQSNPKTVAEVRRILLPQWQLACPRGCSPIGATTVAGKATPPVPSIRHLPPALP